jgi:hypothetical protein
MYSTSDADEDVKGGMKSFSREETEPLKDEDDDFSMSISYDYGERDYDYGDPFADQQRGGQWRKDSGEDDQEEKDRKIEEILNRPPREDIDIIP